VGSIEYIHARIIEKRNAGTAVLLVSPELDEVLALSDRIAVMYRGRMVAIVPAERATKEYLGLLMAGVDPASLPPPEVNVTKAEAVF
jgi:simple sugar transport system ATP-binding protein